MGRKMEIEQQKLDQDHQKFLSEKEAGARAEKEADEQRTKEWINERKRREQEQLESAEGASDNNQRGPSPARGGKEGSCATTPDSSASDRHGDEMLLNEKEKHAKEEGRKERRNRKGDHSRDQTEVTPSSTKSEHHISVKEGKDGLKEEDEPKTKSKQEANGNSRRGGKKRNESNQRHNNGNNVQIELPAPRPPAPIAQPEQAITRAPAQQQTPAVITAPVASMAQPWNADLDPPFNPSGNHRKSDSWSLNADSDPEFKPSSQPKQSNHWSLNPEADPIVGGNSLSGAIGGSSLPIGSIGRKVAPIGSIGQKPSAVGQPIGQPIGASKTRSVGAAPGRW